MLVTMRRVLSPQRDVMGNLSRHGGGACVSERTGPYFRDIYDHLTRIHESIEAAAIFWATASMPICPRSASAPTRS